MSTPQDSRVKDLLQDQLYECLHLFDKDRIGLLSNEQIQKSASFHFRGFN